MALPLLVGVHSEVHMSKLWPIAQGPTDFPFVSTPHVLLRQLFVGHCWLGFVKCARSSGTACLLVSPDGVFEANHGCVP